MFVADFIGSPPMNFLPFQAPLAPRRRAQSASTARAIAMPAAARGSRRGRPRRSACGPSMCRFDDGSALRGEVFGAEYLGTTQIVTRRRPSAARSRRGSPPTIAVRAGETVGLAFRPEQLSLFDKASGRAIRTGAARGRPPWLRSRSTASASASATSRPSTTCRSPSATASSSSCSARPAPARRRRCASSPAWSGPTPARVAHRRRAT